MSDNLIRQIEEACPWLRGVFVGGCMPMSDAELAEIAGRNGGCPGIEGIAYSQY
jgi:hypothetical protein